MKSRPASEERFTWQEIFSEAAKRIGGGTGWMDDSGQAGEIILPDGRRMFFHKGVLDLNGVAASRIAKDKGFTTAFLASKGYAVAEERLFFRASYAARAAFGRGPEAAKRYAGELGYPVFVKAAHLSQGRGVAKVHDDAEFDRAVEAALRDDTVMLVQRAYDGTDLRLVIVDGTILDAYVRMPFEVEGDGVHDVEALIGMAQSRFEAEGRDTVLDPRDWRLMANLQRARLTLEDVPAAGRRVRLQDIANLSLGGSAVDAIGLSPDIESLAREIAAALSLRFCGVDFIVERLPDGREKPVILEVNSAPGLDNYLYFGRAPFDFVCDRYAQLLSAIA